MCWKTSEVSVFVTDCKKRKERKVKFNLETVYQIMEFGLYFPFLSEILKTEAKCKIKTKPRKTRRNNNTSNSNNDIKHFQFFSTSAITTRGQGLSVVASSVANDGTDEVTPANFRLSSPVVTTNDNNDVRFGPKMGEIDS